MQSNSRQSSPLTRRAFLSGQIKTADCSKLAVRLPGAVAEKEFLKACTRCDQCIESCPQSIIRKDSAGYPHLDFSASECVFCGECQKVCPEPLFDTDHDITEGLSHRHQLHISDQCLAAKNIVCQICRDECPHSAIRFLPSVGHVGTPKITSHDCTVCGACIKTCPSQAISVQAKNDVDSKVQYK